MNKFICPHCGISLGRFCYTDTCPHCHEQLQHNSTARLMARPEMNPHKQKAWPARMILGILRLVEN